MIKKFSCILVLACTFLVIACSSDSDSAGTKVKYRITTDSGMIISTINYRDADGSFVTVTASNPNEWIKEITVDRPFAANVDAMVSNTADFSKAYNVIIYIDGQESTTQSGTVDQGQTQAIGNSTNVQ